MNQLPDMNELFNPYKIPLHEEFEGMYLTQTDNHWKIYNMIFNMRRRTCNFSCIGMLGLFHGLRTIGFREVDIHNIEKVMFKDFLDRDKEYREITKRLLGFAVRPRNSGLFLTEKLNVYFEMDTKAQHPVRRFKYEIPLEQNSQRKVKEEIMKNKSPVMVSTDLYKSGHFIVIYGWNESCWLVHDPFYSVVQKRKLSKKKKELGNAKYYPFNRFKIRSICY